MTSDSIPHRPTESLILPTKRRFFPFKIPNFHTQLRHYISTADPDRIYVVVERIVYAIHIASQKREDIAVIPFEPRCLAAGFGGLQAHEGIPSHLPSDVDSALPVDIDPASRLSTLENPTDGPSSTRHITRQSWPEFERHKFGGSIVNSVTIHQFPGTEEDAAPEDVLIISNNDRTVTVYSLTHALVVKVFHHPFCMNYAIVSPDHSLLAAVGDENRAYFYTITRDWELSSSKDKETEKIMTWGWELIRCLFLRLVICVPSDLSPGLSPSWMSTSFATQTARQQSFATSRLLERVLKGGAVRCMTFSPEPWDLLVWLEGHGRAGVADVRQAFLRRQTLYLDTNEPLLQKVHTERLIVNDPEGSLSDDDDLEIEPQVGTDADESLNERTGDGNGLRDSLIQDLGDRERLILDFLNAARWTARAEESFTERPDRPDRPERPSRAGLHPQATARTRHHGSTDGATRTSRPTSPRHSYETADSSLDSHLDRAGSDRSSFQPRRQSSVILSQGSRSPEVGSSSQDRQSNSLRWTASRSAELTAIQADVMHRLSSDPDVLSDDFHSRDFFDLPPRPTDDSGPSLEFEYTPETPRRRPQRSSSIPRRPDRLSHIEFLARERRFDPARVSTYEIRANVAAERLRRQRRMANAVHERSSDRDNVRSLEREHLHRQIAGLEQANSAWVRNVISELPERSLIHGPGAEEPDATAGVGWGADGRSLYIATLEGIFEFHINIHDRKTFPIFSCR
ncbi:hypothetical protein N7481_011503 [Penicillium waksmanii]|uniref:uncharacterized protein n=1 Tax=Penicillium waksmanii TaxID=69791 RepID=UPI002547D6D1|nr:uncharacterized protein N7481_011503 [Penicillium waksmanii]KAJ5974293.1 hypothetical protein N7481_011503 [Penicillium waksmanii]